MVMMVSFKLQGDSTSFVDALKSLGNWSNRVEGAWVLESSLHPRQVRDLLGHHMAPGDRLFIAEITQQWAGRGMGEGFPEWMKRRESFTR